MGLCDCPREVNQSVLEGEGITARLTRFERLRGASCKIKPLKISRDLIFRLAGYNAQSTDRVMSEESFA